MKKMKFSFFALLLLLMFGLQYGNAQGVSFGSVANSEIIPIMKEYQENLVGKTEAFDILSQELKSLGSIVPANDNQEIELSLKTEFVQKAISEIQKEVPVADALISGTYTANASLSTFKNADDGLPIEFLEFYANMLSN